MSTASHFHFCWAQCSHIFSFFLNLGFPYASHTPPIHPPHAQKKCFFPRFCQFWNPESPKYWDFPGLHKHRFSGLKTCPQIMVAEYFSRWMIRPKPNLSTKDSSISWCLLWKVQWYPASNNYSNVCMYSNAELSRLYVYGEPESGVLMRWVSVGYLTCRAIFDAAFIPFVSNSCLCPCSTYL